MGVDYSLRRYEWGAVTAGSVAALAISAVLMQFGAGIGLSATSPLRGEGNVAAWGVVATGIWLVWAQLFSSMAGGYIAGRLRSPLPGSSSHDAEMRDGVSGLLSWALATVIAFVFAAIVGAFSTYVSIATDNYQAAGDLTESKKNAAVIFSFVAGAASVISAAAAWWAGTMGGEHRDEETDFSRFLSFKKIGIATSERLGIHKDGGF